MPSVRYLVAQELMSGRVASVRVLVDHKLMSGRIGSVSGLPSVLGSHLVQGVQHRSVDAASPAEDGSNR